MSEHGGFGGPTPSGGMTENLNALLHPPAAGPAPIQDMTSILRDPAQHFQLDLHQAPKAIAAFRQVAQGMRDLMDEASRLADVPAPGLDAVSINAAKEIGQWAASEKPGSLRWALESGAIQLEKAAKALEQSLATHRNIDLEQSLATHRNIDEVNAAQLSRPQL